MLYWTWYSQTIKNRLKMWRLRAVLDAGTMGLWCLSSWEEWTKQTTKWQAWTSKEQILACAGTCLAQSHGKLPLGGSKGPKKSQLIFRDSLFRAQEWCAAMCRQLRNSGNRSAKRTWSSCLSSHAEGKDSEGVSRDRLLRIYKEIACEGGNGVRKAKAHQELKPAGKVRDNSVFL